MKINYERIKLVVIMKDKTRYNFVTEEYSLSKTLWIYNLDKYFLTVFNENGTRFSFPLNSIEVFFELPKIEVINKDTLTITEIKEKVIEVNDFIKYSPIQETVINKN